MIKTAFSVVIAGNMNPAIHHPGWYTVGPEWFVDEAATARERGELVVTRELSRFTTPNFVVQCLQGNWQATTTSLAHFSRVVDLAASTFERLNETAVRAFGLNTEYRGAHRASDTEAAEARRLLRLPAKSSLTSYTFREDLEPLTVDESTQLTRQLNAHVEFDGDGRARIKTNVHHEIVLQGLRHFDLTPMLHAATDNMATADATAERILADNGEA